MSGIRKSPRISRDEVVELYRAGYSRRTISIRADMPHYWVDIVLSAAHEPIRLARGKSLNPRRIKRPERITEEQVVALYLAGEGLDTVGVLAGRSHGWVRAAVLRAGHQIRSLQESQIVSAARAKISPYPIQRCHDLLRTFEQESADGHV